MTAILTPSRRFVVLDEADGVQPPPTIQEERDEPVRSRPCRVTMNVNVVARHNGQGLGVYRETILLESNGSLTARIASTGGRAVMMDEESLTVEIPMNLDGGAPEVNEAIDLVALRARLEEARAAELTARAGPYQRQRERLAWSRVQGYVSAALLLAAACSLGYSQVLQRRQRAATPAAVSTTTQLQAEPLEAGEAVWLKSSNPPLEPRPVVLALPPGVKGQSYQAALDVKPGDTWSLADGTLPPGLQLSSDGRIYGTPTEVGTRILALRRSMTGGESVATVRKLEIRP